MAAGKKRAPLSLSFAAERRRYCQRDDGDTCQQHSGYCGADAEPLSAGRRILLVPGCSVFVLVRPGGSRAFGKNGLGRKGKVSGQPKAEKSGAGLVC